MAKRRRRKENLESQIKTHSSSKKKKQRYKGNSEVMIPTGSTLLDLAISGGRKRGGGIPAQIMVVAYGPSGSGKTVLACEVAGAIQRAGGELKYRDAEARLDLDFAETFDLNIEEIDRTQPNTVSEAFLDLHKWEPDSANVNGYIIDSLAALSTDMEMDKDEGDKMGMRRAKEFSEHLRKGAREIKEKNLILFCTNQIRQNADAGPYARKDVNPGGKAIEFYASLILRFSKFKKIKDKIKFKGDVIERTVGIEGTIEVDKSSIWKPFRSAPITIFFDYGIDDIRENLNFIKKYTKSSVFTVRGQHISNKREEAIKIVEEKGLEEELKNEVIDLWEEIESKFESNRKKKKR